MVLIELVNDTKTFSLHDGMHHGMNRFIDKTDYFLYIFID